MRDFDRASEFIEKANKWLSWSDSNYQEMLEHGKRGRIQDVERAFVSLLLLLDSIHQSLVDAAKKLDEHAWRNLISAKPQPRKLEAWRKSGSAQGLQPIIA